MSSGYLARQNSYMSFRACCFTLSGIAGPADGGVERAVPESGRPQVLASIAVGATGAAINLV